MWAGKFSLEKQTTEKEVVADTGDNGEHGRTQLWASLFGGLLEKFERSDENLNTKLMLICFVGSDLDSIFLKTPKRNYQEIYNKRE